MSNKTMITPEQKERLSKLSPEQQAIAEKWDKERAELDAGFQSLAKAIDAQDEEQWKDALKNLTEKTPSMCEHERSVWSNCAGCDEIDQALHPELFCAQCNVPFSMCDDGTEDKPHNEGDICPDCEYENGTS